jgi:mRNA interferase RelE/StbE
MDLPVATWKVELVPEAKDDFGSLDGSVKKRVLKQLVKLEQNPKYGDPLGNKAGINLEGYFKLYADKKRIRIIYEVIGDVIKIVAIDKRENMEVYRIALKRILSMKSN